MTSPDDRDGGARRESERPRDESVERRRSRARRNAIVLALVVVAIYVGYLLFGLIEGVFPG